jgi:precorrin-2 dehydrogenase/sirohydrochlorin ferrochelatase
VVGSGPVARRKLAGLHQAGARIRLIAPAPPEDLELAQVDLVRRDYQPGDLQGAALVFAATGNRTVNHAVAAEARSAGIPVNVADLPEEGDFTLPALLRRGDLTVTVATAGQSPALAAVVRDHLGATLGPEWSLIVDLAGALRRRRLTPSPDDEYNQSVFRRLLVGGLPALVAAGDAAAIDRLLDGVIPGVSLEELGIGISKGLP